MRFIGGLFFLTLLFGLTLIGRPGVSYAQCGFAPVISDFKCNADSGFDPYKIGTPGYNNGKVYRPSTPHTDEEVDGGFNDNLGQATGTCTALTPEHRQEYLQHLKLREGVRKCVYRDSLGYPTVGVGHLVLPQDNLSVGQCISDAQVNAFLEKDSQKAWNAAIQQAREAGINDGDFIVALASVNFQLGTGWRSKFPQTWQQIKSGQYEAAAQNIGGTKWAQQTPVRVRDFQAALRELARCSSQQRAAQ